MKLFSPLQIKDFCFSLFVIALFMGLSCSSALSSRISTTGTAGTPFQLSELVSTNPDYFIGLLQHNIRLGNLAQMAELITELRQVQPDNSELHAFSAINSASQLDLTKAHASLAQARKQLKKDNFLLLCAEAMVLRLEKDFDGAIAKAQAAIRQNPNHPYPLNILGRVHFDKSQYQLANKNFQKAIALESSFLPAYLNLGSTAYMLGDLSSAVEHFNTALELNPNSNSAHMGLSLVYENAGEFELAAENLQKAFGASAMPEESLARLGSLLLQAEKYQQALEIGLKMNERGAANASTILAEAALHLGKLEEALQYCEQASNPEDPDLLYARGYVYMVQEEYAKALQTMKAILAKNANHAGAAIAKMVLEFERGSLTLEDSQKLAPPQDNVKGLFHYLRGNITAYFGDTTLALRQWSLANGFIPGFTILGIEARHLLEGLNTKEIKPLNLGVLFYLRNLDKPAEKLFTSTTEINSQSIFGNYWQAQVFLKNGMKKKALVFYENALSSTPSFYAGLYAAGELSFLTGDTDKALTYYQRALTIKNDAGILIKIGLIYENHSQFNKAAEYYRQITQLYPDYFVGYNQLAWLYAKQGIKLDEALKLAGKANTLQPGNASILDTLGWIFYHQEEYDKSVQFFKKSLKIVPNNPSVLYHLGAAQHATENSVAAKANIEKALEIQQDFDQSEEAKRLLQSMQK